MLFKPTHKYHIFTEEEFSHEISAIEQELHKYSVSGKIKSFDGCELAYEYFPVKNSIGSVVLIHGFTEFYKKFYEMTWYFINMGYSVFLYDQRGHGLSGREVDNLQLTHVKDFNDYVKDLDCIIEQLVVPNSGNSPIYLMGHSMGGAVAAIYLLQNSSRITRAILSSPMIYPRTHGIPGGLVRIVSVIQGIKKGWNSRFKYSSEFNFHPDYNNGSDSSPSRFRHNLDYRINNEFYRNSSFSNRWIYEALKVRRIIFGSHSLKDVSTELMIISAGNDHVVYTGPHKRLSRKLPHCTLVTLPESKHTVYTCQGPVLDYFYETVFKFFSKC